MTSYYFLEGDFKALAERIDELAAQMREVGREMGRSCGEGAETFHDNFAYEEGERQQRMLSQRLREMIHIRNHAKVVRPRESVEDRVAIGRTVTIEDEDTGQTRRMRVGSYMVFSSGGTLSYNCPLVRALMGAQVGESRTVRLRDGNRNYEIVQVE